MTFESDLGMQADEDTLQGEDRRHDIFPSDLGVQSDEDMLQTDDHPTVKETTPSDDQGHEVFLSAVNVQVDEETHQTGDHHADKETLPSDDQRHAVSRRVALRRWGLGATVGLGASTLGFGMMIEPHHPVLEIVKIPIKGLPASLEGLKIVQLSDLHVQPAFPSSALTPAIRLAQSANPDLILITGDYINDDIEDGSTYMRQCADRLAELKAPLGVFASFGNHDFPPPPGDPSPEPWIAAGIRPLCDDVVVVKKAGEPFYIVGLRSFTQRPVSPADMLLLAPADRIRIVMWHEPDRAIECARGGASLQLSGHTHGGQVVLPLTGPPVLPYGGKLYPSGLFWVGGMPLYVSRGVGLLSPRIRLNCPPEVTLIVLEKA